MRNVFFLSMAFVLMSLAAAAQTITGPGSGLNRPTTATATLALGGTVTGATTLDYTTSTTANFLIRKGTANYFFIGNDGRIGIGTNAPANKLSITGALATNFGLQFPGVTNATATTTNTNRVLTLDASGNVIWSNVSTNFANGITGMLPIANGGTGTATTSANFIFAGPTAAAGAPAFRALVAADIPVLDMSKITTGNLPIARIGNITSGRLLGRFTTAVGVVEEITIGTGLNLSSTGTLTAIGGGTSPWTTGTLATNITNTNTGNVGIGTPTPAYKLDVNGNASISGDAIIAGNGTNVGFKFTGINSYDEIQSLRAAGMQINAVNGTLNLGGKAPGNVTMNRQLRIFSDNDGLDGLILKPASINTVARPGTTELTIGANQIDAIKISSTGNVGIGTTTPAYKLDVNGDTRLGGAATINNNLSVLGSSMQLGSASQTGQVFIGLKQSTNAGTPDKGWNFGYTSSSSNDLYTYGYENAAYRLFTNATERLTVTGDGNVGIGTSAPSQKLHLYGPNPMLFIEGDVNSYYPGIRIKSNVGDGLVETYGLNGIAGMNLVVRNASGLGAQVGATLGGAVANSSNPDNVTFRVMSSQAQVADIFQVSKNVHTVPGTWAEQKLVVVNKDGNMGIGTPTPDAKLHVAGNFKLVDGTQGVGKVLTSDANGVASWQPASGGGGSGLWTDAGSGNIYSTTLTGNVGIGTSTPVAKLHVAGNITSPGAGVNSERFGLGALTDETYATAFGYQAHAKNGVAVGGDAHALGDYTNAFGYAANANGFGSIAIGHGAITTVNSGYGTAIGFGSKSSHGGSIVIGVNTESSDANQLVLGGDIREMIVGMNPQSALAAVYGGVKIRTTDGLGTDNAGASMKLSAGRGTGAASGGFMSFSTTPAGSAGSVLNAEVERMRITASGNVGIGTTNPSAKLHTSGSLRFEGLATNNTLTNILAADASGNISWRDASTFGSGGGASQWTTSSTNIYYNTGNVGIGTTNITDAGYKLFVEGAIRSRKVRVDQLTWSDFVFDNDYRLPSLPEVEKFIKDNHHLADVPSAKEVEKEGLDLGNNQAVLLRKIEELTLYIIDLNKKSEEQNKKITELQKQDTEMKELKKQMEELKKMILKK